VPSWVALKHVDVKEFFPVSGISALSCLSKLTTFYTGRTATCPPSCATVLHNFEQFSSIPGKRDTGFERLTLPRNNAKTHVLSSKWQVSIITHRNNWLRHARPQTYKTSPSNATYDLGTYSRDGWVTWKLRPEPNGFFCGLYNDAFGVMNACRGTVGWIGKDVEGGCRHLNRTAIPGFARGTEEYNEKPPSG
jgi:hypothetical protein